MDDFYMNVYPVILKKWILSQSYDWIEVGLQLNDSNTIALNTKFSESTITFHKMGIVEMSVKNSTNQRIEFYLHFQIKNFRHALKLYDEMIGCIAKLIAKPMTKVLLCCSGGLTTAYFATLIDQATKLLHMNIEVAAIGYQNVFYAAQEYDMVMLAPQIAYEYPKTKKALISKQVILIPPQVFATYDVNAMISIITTNLQQGPHQPAAIKPLKLVGPYQSPGKVLVMSIFRNSQRVHIAYRMYGQKQEIIIDDDIIKPTITIEDIGNIIDMVATKHDDLITIGISTPGIIHNSGLLTSTSIVGFDRIYLQDILESKYSAKIVINNDVNTAAVGYYATQQEYQSLSFLFQPIHHHAGCGMVINGQLIKGNHHLAGEIKYLPLDLSNRQLQLNRTIDGSIELVSKIILTVMGVISPEAILFYCDLITDGESLYRELAKTIDKAYLPKIIKVTNMIEYTLAGQLILCANGE